MSDVLTLSQMEKMIAKFCSDRNWDQFHTPKDLAIGTVTEAAELLDLFRFKTDVQIQAMLLDDDSRAIIGQELADILYFLIRFSQRYGFDLYQEFINKMSINEKKYPLDLAKGNNQKYTEY